MQSRLQDLMNAFADFYGGWIVWNLFLAFIPLILSFILFRKQTRQQPWLLALCGLTGLLGAIGFWIRRPMVLGGLRRLGRSVLAGDVGAVLALAWFGLLFGIALALSFWLFKRRQSVRTTAWWLALAVFIAFLPNAPYVLTDIIHLIRGTSSGSVPIWAVVLVFIPIHVTAILIGFEAYVISLLNQGYYLRQQGAQQFILPAELLMHGLSAIGIFLGRFIRFNSWDLITNPGDVFGVTLATLTSRRPLAVMVVTFIILTVLYWLMKQVTLGLKLRIHYARKGLDVWD